MIDLLLNSQNVIIALVVLALATPPLAYAARRRWPEKFPHRPAILAGGFGPFALFYWGFHNLILAVVGCEIGRAHV